MDHPCRRFFHHCNHIHGQATHQMMRVLPWPLLPHLRKHSLDSDGDDFCWGCNLKGEEQFKFNIGLYYNINISVRSCRNRNVDDASCLAIEMLMMEFLYRQRMQHLREFYHESTTVELSRLQSLCNLSAALHTSSSRESKQWYCIDLLVFHISEGFFVK